MDRSFTEGMKYSQPGSPPYKLYQIADEDDTSGVGEQAIQHQPKTTLRDSMTLQGKQAYVHPQFKQNPQPEDCAEKTHPISHEHKPPLSAGSWAQQLGSCRPATIRMQVSALALPGLNNLQSVCLQMLASGNCPVQAPHAYRAEE